jgi:hypothetical protein
MTKRARVSRAAAHAAERAALEMLLTEPQIRGLSEYADEPADLPRLGEGRCQHGTKSLAQARKAADGGDYRAGGCPSRPRVDDRRMSDGPPMHGSRAPRATRCGGSSCRAAAPSLFGCG